MSTGVIDHVIHHSWREAEAEVIDCKFVPANLRAPGFGVVGGDPAYYAVGFKYRVDGITYRGSLRSSVEVMRGDKFSVLYNPERPKENNSIASDCERWWFRDYLYVAGALVLGLIIFDIVRSLFFH
jgi:hypothetical protein